MREICNYLKLLNKDSSLQMMEIYKYIDYLEENDVFITPNKEVYFVHLDDNGDKYVKKFTGPEKMDVNPHFYKELSWIEILNLPNVLLSREDFNPINDKFIKKKDEFNVLYAEKENLLFFVINPSEIFTEISYSDKNPKGNITLEDIIYLSDKDAKRTWVFY